MMHNCDSNINPLSRKEKHPPLLAQKRAKEMLSNKESLFIFVDASELEYQGIFGVAACFVGQDEVIVQHRKIYDPVNRTKINIAELRAVLFAFERLPKILANKFERPTNILIYSDQSAIQDSVAKNSQTQALLDQIQQQTNKFNPPVSVNYLEKEMKKYNPFYRAAHNGARKAIGK